jgi:exopolysaccharide production protein ExoQ
MDNNMTTMTLSPEPEVASVSKRRPLTLLAVTWLALPILLWLSVHGTFSFQGVAENDSAEPALVQTVTEQDTLAGRFQKAMTAPLLLIFVFPFFTRGIRVWKMSPLFTALAALTVLSIMWSQFPLRSIAFSLNAVLCIFFALCFYLRFPAEDQLRLIYWTGAIIVLSSVVMVILFPHYGTQGGVGGLGEWKGLFHTKNVLARTCVFLLTPALFTFRDRPISRLSRTSYVLLLLFVIFKSGSRTGLIDAAACVLFCLLIRFLGGVAKKDALLMVAVGVGIAAAGTVIILQHLPVILVALGKDSTLTGRTAIWNGVMQSVTKRPILGYGYGGFWWGTRGEAYNIDSRVGWMVPYAHNGFLDIWLDLGIVGFGLIVATFIKAIRDGIRSIRGERSSYVQWCLSIVFLTVLYNLDEGTLLAQTELVWVLYIVACTGLAMEARRAQGRWTVG